MARNLALRLSPDGMGEFILSDDMDIGITMQALLREMESLGVVVEGKGAVKGMKTDVNPMFLCG